MSNPEKFIQLQHQMRENQEELQDFLKDLDSWENEIKAKDETLKTTKSEEDSLVSNLPPVRNSLDIKKKKKKHKPKKENAETKSTPKRISGYDFKAWDKFDVDKACDEVDREKEKKASSESEYETDEEWEESRKKQQAVVEKDKGNAFFKEGKYDAAIECYTRGMECDPTYVLLPANRAMALLKQNKYAAAEMDCTKAITLDPMYTKAFSRRAAARMGLNKLQEAKHDNLHVLKLEPSNKQAKAELEKIERLLAPPLDPEPEPIKSVEAGVVKPVYKPPEQRSKKPLRRIQIEEIGDDEEEIQRKKEEAKAKAAQSDISQKIAQQDAQMFDKLLGHGKEQPATAQSAGPHLSVKHANSETSVPVSSENPSENPQSAGKQTNGPSKMRKIQIEEVSSDEEPAAEDTLLPKTSVNSEKVAPTETLSSSKDVVEEKVVPSSGKIATTVSSVVPSGEPQVPSAPATSYQFQADWKVLKNQPQKFHQYFKQITPSSLPKLFGEALDADILQQVLMTLKNFYIPEKVDVFQVMSSLANVKRFAMTVMFMSSKDKDVIKELFTYMKSSSSASATDITKLQAKYGL